MNTPIARRPPRGAGPRDVHCPTCRKLIFDGEVLLARVTRFAPNAAAEACCKICKTWVKVPVEIATKGAQCVRGNQ